MIISYREKQLWIQAAETKNSPSAYPWNVSMESKVDHTGERFGDPYIPDGLKVTRIKINKSLEIGKDDRKYMPWEALNQMDGPGVEDKPTKDN